MPRWLLLDAEAGWHTVLVDVNALPGYDTHMDIPQTQYPISLAQASELTGIAVSTLSDVARRIGVGRKFGNARLRLLSKADMRKVLAAKRAGPGRPKLVGK